MRDRPPFAIPESDDQATSSQPPPRPGFGFLLGGTTLGILFGCVLLCAGASPPHVIIIILAICGAVTGGLLESLWPKQWPSTQGRKSSPYNDISESPFREERERGGARSRSLHSESHHECRRCGEVFEPSPVICPMCGHAEKSPRLR